MSIKGDPYTNTRAGVPVNSATVQTGIGLGRETVQRLDRLRAVYGKSRSFVADLALTSGGLDMVETNNAADIERFNDLAADADMTWQEYVEAYVTDFGTKTYPPTVAQLEERKWRRTVPARRLPKVGHEAMDMHRAAVAVTQQFADAVREVNQISEDAKKASADLHIVAEDAARATAVPRGLRDVLG
jgi:hypothetical protein